MFPARPTTVIDYDRLCKRGVQSFRNTARADIGNAAAGLVTMRRIGRWGSLAQTTDAGRSGQREQGEAPDVRRERTPYQTSLLNLDCTSTRGLAAGTDQSKRTPARWATVFHLVISSATVWPWLQARALSVQTVSLARRSATSGFHQRVDLRIQPCKQRCRHSPPVPSPYTRSAFESRQVSAIAGTSGNALAAAASPPRNRNRPA